MQNPFWIFRYLVIVKARDKAGLYSPDVSSAPILIDSTPPAGVSCSRFQLEDETTLTFTPTSSSQPQSYRGTLRASPMAQDKLLKLELHADRLEQGAGGYVEMEERRMPLSFQHLQSGEARAQHEFLSAGTAGSPVSVAVVVQGHHGAVVTARLYSCSHTQRDDSHAVTVRQLSPHVISVCARVVDEESGVQSLKVGLGTTEGGVQIRPFTYLAHSGHFQFTEHVQHATMIYASVIAENHAGQWTRLVSQPVVVDRTAPEVSEVEVTVRYEGEGQVNATLEVWADARWTAADGESDMASCICQLGMGC